MRFKKAVLDKKMRGEMGENAYRKLKEDFSWDRISKQTIEIYKKAIQAHEKNQ